MEADPQAAWLVVACDLPFLTHDSLKDLIERRNHLKVATAFASDQGGRHKDLPEPLCAIYEPKSRIRLMEYLALGYECPRKVLINSPICLLKQRSAGSLDNMNTPQDLKEMAHGR